jgi:hypothetical protein
VGKGRTSSLEVKAEGEGRGWPIASPEPFINGCDMG